ncbi:MAG: purine-nucleoside phosphorylase [Firmicutes bacterium]|nr:purine-nucleoside phosphorylase [Bacillota bacterium]
MNYLDKLTKAKDYIQSRINIIPDTLVILGSGLGDFSKVLENTLTIPYSEIPYFNFTQVEGHSGELHMGLLNKKWVFCMNGRNHYYEGASDEEMRFPIQLFATLNVKNVIVTNACGGMNSSFKPGDLMVIEDHINLMGRNPLIGRNLDTIGPRFSDMSQAYDEEFLIRIQKIAKTEKIELKKGIYVGYSGPNYETKAEIKAFSILGGDAVGMSTVPEVIVANHAKMRVLGISCITNMATGLQKNRLTHDEVLETSRKALNSFSTLVSKFIDTL